MKSSPDVSVNSDTKASQFLRAMESIANSCDAETIDKAVELLLCRRAACKPVDNSAWTLKIRLTSSRVNELLSYRAHYNSLQALEDCNCEFDIDNGRLEIKPEGVVWEIITEGSAVESDLLSWETLEELADDSALLA